MLVARDDTPIALCPAGDKHVIKLTEAALREYPRTENATLLVGADRFRDRVSAG